MAYALVWPASASAILVSVLRPSLASPIILYFFLFPVALVGAIATVRAASRARGMSADSLRLATVAATIGWVEILLTIIVAISVSVWIIVAFVDLLDNGSL